MKIEPIPYTSFQSLVSCTHALHDPDNQGCAWYATTDRRVAGRIYFVPKQEQFRTTVLHFVRAGWEVTECSKTFDTLETAEVATIDAMRKLTDGGVTLVDVPARMRFGKGRKKETAPSIESDI